MASIIASAAASSGGDVNNDNGRCCMSCLLSGSRCYIPDTPGPSEAMEVDNDSTPRPTEQTYTVPLSPADSDSNWTPHSGQYDLQNNPVLSYQGERSDHFSASSIDPSYLLNPAAGYFNPSLSLPSPPMSTTSGCSVQSFIELAENNRQYNCHSSSGELL